MIKIRLCLRYYGLGGISMEHYTHIAYLFKAEFYNDHCGHLEPIVPLVGSFVDGCFYSCGACYVPFDDLYLRDGCSPYVFGFPFEIYDYLCDRYEEKYGVVDPDDEDAIEEQECYIDSHFEDTCFNYGSTILKSTYSFYIDCNHHVSIREVNPETGMVVNVQFNQPYSQPKYPVNGNGKPKLFILYPPMR